MDEFRWFLPLSKVEQQSDGTVIVEGLVSSEAIDSEDEIVDYDGLKKAAEDYMQFANVREMHDDKTASGVMLKLDADDATRTITGRALVVDPVAVKKVLTRVYKGFSIGGRKLAFGPLEKSGARSIRRLVKMWWAETSLVDRPANPHAIFTLAKRDYTEDRANGDANDVATRYRDEGSTSPEPATRHSQTDPEGLNKVADGDLAQAMTSGADTGDNPEVQQTAAQNDAAADAAQPGAKKARKAAKAVRAFAGKVEELAKGNKTLKHLGDAVESIVCAIAEEATEGDTDGVATLQGLLNSVTKAMSAEAAEGDADEDEELLPEMDGDMVAAYAAQVGDLRKAAEEKTLRKMRKAARREMREAGLADLVKALRAETAVSSADAKPSADADSPPDPLAKASSAIDNLMAKVSDSDRVTPADLANAKAEILTVLNSTKEDLAKAIAAQPMPGGPLARPDLARFGISDDATEAQMEAQVLAKAIGRVSDPVGKEALGKFAAAEQIKVIQQGG